MIVFSVLYPAAAGARFDAAYYKATHIPLVEQAFRSSGLRGVQVLHGLSAGDGGAAPYLAIAHFSFESAAALNASLTGPRAAEVFGDIANFTTIQPVTQISAPL